MVVGSSDHERNVRKREGRTFQPTEKVYFEGRRLSSHEATQGFRLLCPVGHQSTEQHGLSLDGQQTPCLLDQAETLHLEENSF